MVQAYHHGDTLPAQMRQHGESGLQTRCGVVAADVDHIGVGPTLGIEEATGRGEGCGPEVGVYGLQAARPLKRGCRPARAAAFADASGSMTVTRSGGAAGESAP